MSNEPSTAEAPQSSGEKRIDMTVLLIGLITYGIGQTLLYIVLGPIIRDIGINEIQYGALISASNVAIVLTAPWWGRTSQRIGRKPVLIIGLLGYAVGYALLAFGVQIGMDGVVTADATLPAWVEGTPAWLNATIVIIASPIFLLLMGARLVYGALASAIQPAATAYIADTTDEEGRTKGMALVSMTAGLGTIIGPVFAIAFARLGVLAPMYVAAAMAVVSAILVGKYITEPEKHTDANAANDGDVTLSWFDKRIFPYLLGWVIGFMIFTAMQPLVPFLAQDQLGLTETSDITDVVGIALLCMGLVNVIVLITLMQRIKLAPPVTLRIAFVLFGLVLLCLPFVTSTWAFYLTFAGMGFAFSLIVPNLNSGATLSVKPHEQGATAGLLTAAPTLGMIFGPFGGTVLYRLVDPTFPIFVSAGISLLMGLYFCFIKPPQSAATETDAGDSQGAK